MAKRKIVEPEVLLADKKVFGDKKEHEYVVECYDGYAVGKLDDEEDTTAPKEVFLEYPKRKDVLKDKNLAERILEYRGLYDLEIKDIHYGDIMMYMGKIVRKSVEIKR